MIRFVHTQANGQQRAIDDAKKGQHNLFTSMRETISSIGTDWIAEAASVFAAQALRAWGQPKRWTAPFPSWIFRMHTGDARAIPKI